MDFAGFQEINYYFLCFYEWEFVFEQRHVEILRLG